MSTCDTPWAGYGMDAEEPEQAPHLTHKWRPRWNNGRITYLACDCTALIPVPEPPTELAFEFATEAEPVEPDDIAPVDLAAEPFPF
jgi:hypothetical protein